MQSKGVVINIVEKKGRLLAVFNSHDGAFKLPAEDPAMRKTLEDSLSKKSEVVFEFRDDMSIVCVAPVQAPDAHKPVAGAGVKP